MLDAQFLTNVFEINQVFLLLCVYFVLISVLNLVIFPIKGLGKYGVLFHNSLIIVIPTLLASAFTGDLHKV